jgi:cyclopropane fatty-acyl-phospholipid synthase-like methyltransferase
VSVKQSASADGGDLRALYDEAYYKDQLHREHWFRNNRAKQELRWRELLRMLVPAAGETVLDLGCAVGEYTLRIAPLVARTIGVDFSEAAIGAATKRALGRGLDVHFVASRVDALPLPSASVDKAMAIDLVEHVDDATVRRMLGETWRVLRPGGTLSLYTPCATHYVERLKARGWLAQIPGHIAVRAPAEYEELFRGGEWEIALRYFSPSTFPVFGWLDRLLAPIPLVGSLFRFRYCAVLRKPA